MEACLYLLLMIFSVTSSINEEEAWTSESDWYPYFGEPMSNITVPLGREAVLTCVVRNLGQFKVGWIRAEDQTVLSLHTRVVTHNPRISVSQDLERGIWRLHIRQLRHSDRGCYMCQINTTTMKKQIGCLDVHVPPEIVDSESSSDMTVSEGDNVTLSCRAKGRPEPRIVWRREDSQPLMVFSQSAGGFMSVDSWVGTVLHLVHVDYRQDGAYLCIATNDIPPAVSKRIVLVVHFAPVVQSPPYRRMGAALGSSILLSCLFHGFPNQNTSWDREIGGIQKYGGEYTMKESRESYQVILDLTIRNLRPIDFGKYFCSVVNDKGIASATIYLDEFRPETSTTDRLPRRSRIMKGQSRITTSKRVITTETIPVLPTFSDDMDNEISELAVEAERRWSVSRSWAMSSTPLKLVILFLVILR